MYDYIKVSGDLFCYLFLVKDSGQQNVEIVNQTFDSPDHCDLKIKIKKRTTLGLEISSVVGHYLL